MSDVKKDKIHTTVLNYGTYSVQQSLKGFKWFSSKMKHVHISSIPRTQKQELCYR